jgi:hypothetical protein
VKREVIVGPAVDKTVAHESVGLKPVTVPKEPPVIKKNAPVLQVKKLSKLHFCCYFTKAHQRKKTVKTISA